jgi:hypothetical protein
MMSDRRTVRVPAPSDLHVEPPLGPLLLLELAAAVAANALRARHVAIEGDFYRDETDEVTTARVLARECDELVETLNDYRRRVLTRLARERSEWPF